MSGYAKKPTAGGGGGKAKDKGQRSHRPPVVPTPRVPHWPDALPAFRGTQFVFSLTCCESNSRLHWARINDVLAPDVVWSTNHPPADHDGSADEPRPNLFEYLPEELRREICASPPRSITITNSIFCSLLLERRQSVLVVYLISSSSSNNHHSNYSDPDERRVLRLFDGLPVVIYRLSPQDFLLQARSGGNSMLRHLSAHATVGVERVAVLAGARQRFPQRRSHLVIDAETALTTYTTTIDDNDDLTTLTKRIGGGVTLGPVQKLITLSALTGALSTSQQEQLVNDMIQQLQSANDVLPETFSTTNTAQSLAGAVLTETAILLGHVIKRWRNALPDDISKEQTPVVILCGSQGQLLATLLGPRAKRFLATSPEIQDFLACGELIESEEQWNNGPATNNTAFQMVYLGSVVHDGVQNILTAQRKLIAAETEMNVLRDELVGQRIIVRGDQGQQQQRRGTILSVSRRAADPAKDDHMYDDTFDVFIDADNAFLEVTWNQLFEGLDEFSTFGEILHGTAKQKIGALNKIKDAKTILPRLCSMLMNSDGKRSSSAAGPQVESATPLQVQTMSIRRNDAPASASPAILAPARVPPPHTAPAPRSNMAASSVGGDESIKTPHKATAKPEESPDSQIRPSTRKRKNPMSVDLMQEGYVGQRVAKYFDKVLFRGHVSSYFSSDKMDSKKEAWQVLYEDGDSEDVYEAQLRKMIALYKRTA